MTATLHALPEPATPDTSAYEHFLALGVSPSDARWLCGPAESLALDLSVAAILGTTRQ